jgi:two-component sensor histidine kinase
MRLPSLTSMCVLAAPETFQAGLERRSWVSMRLLLAPYRLGAREQFVIEGEDVPLGAKSATALALIVHEQATNAVKYGALSTDTGTVRLTGERDGALYRLRWEETGGPLVEGVPERKGFGTQMAARSVSGQLGGTIERDWASDGLRVTISMETEKLLA